jgi:beta-glucosidase-like glycosyl hydrolase
MKTSRLFQRSSTALLILTLLLGCATQPSSMNDRSSLDGSAWVEQKMASLTLEEKVGQLIHVWTLLDYLPEDSEQWVELERLTVEKKIGGFIFSIGDVYEYAVQVNKLQKMADIPLLIAADFEWGAGMRVRKATTFPRAMAVGATHNPAYAYDVGYMTALEARALGVHQNYAPTVDLNNNPRNPVINTRSFGDNRELVNAMSVAYVNGTQDAGVIATVKHFPGHGDTDIDTHIKLPTLNLTRARMDTFELAPYKETFKSGVMSVMVGHLSYPELDDEEGVPATVSPNISVELLQKDLGFDGLIVTDAMVMDGVASKYHPGESVVLAIQAGMDLILMPVDADIAIDALVDAVRRGEITEARIDRSVRKILNAKSFVGVHQNRYIDVEKVATVVNSREHHLKALEIARHAVTVLGNEDGQSKAREHRHCGPGKPCPRDERPSPPPGTMGWGARSCSYRSDEQRFGIRFSTGRRIRRRHYCVPAPSTHTLMGNERLRGRRSGSLHTEAPRPREAHDRRRCREPIHIARSRSVRFICLHVL